MGEGLWQGRLHRVSYVDVRHPIDNRTFKEEAEISRRLGRESLCCFSFSWPVRAEAWCLES